MIENYLGNLHKGTYSIVDKVDPKMDQSLYRNGFQEMIDVQSERVKKTAELAEYIVDRIFTTGCVLFVVGLILMPTPLGLGLLITGIAVSIASLAAYLFFQAQIKKQKGDLDTLVEVQKLIIGSKHDHKGVIAVGKSEEPKTEELVDLEIYKTYMQNPQSKRILANLKDPSPNAVRNLLFHRQKLREHITQIKHLREKGADSSAIVSHQTQIRYHLAGLSSHVDRDIPKVSRENAIQES